jgi:hypothetical protein
MFNTCMLWLLVVVLVHITMYLAMSYMYYNIIQGSVRGFIAALVRKVQGGSRLVC